MAKKNKKEIKIVNNQMRGKKKQILNYKDHIQGNQIEELQNKIKALTQEMSQKDARIKKFQEQLALSNDMVVQLTQQVDRDLQKLSRLHENLIPTQFPSIPNCEFSFKFVSAPKGKGKDFYQVIPVKKMHFGLLISSCVSHILSSLLFSSRLRLMSQMNDKNLSPADVLQALVKEISGQYKMSDIPLNIDIFYAVMNRRTYRLSYCSAGKIYAFSYRSSTKQVQQLEPAVPDFNVNHLKELSNQKMSFNPRDRLILCSPGIVSAVNKKGEIYGIERLKKVIQTKIEPGPHSLRNEILYAVQSFTKNKKAPRDKSIVVMEIKDRILKLAQ